MKSHDRLRIVFAEARQNWRAFVDAMQVHENHYRKRAGVAGIRARFQGAKLAECKGGKVLKWALSRFIGTILTFFVIKCPKIWLLVTFVAFATKIIQPPGGEKCLLNSMLRTISQSKINKHFHLLLTKAMS
ncbi:hypothetical protein AAC97_004147 [Salmonella enterica subsp. enterica]|nr:hypothetical protein [Salmonella enterica]EBX1480123.1 hypothetical protein [Salmonella enterica subsp. enterica serovar Chester]EDQ6579110.1 hypothetical protein [Salmonella enterica subsp. enterica]EAX7453356.1 hypothetical protein [Salmonella enterica]EAX7464656.1 hypothetical protein [Salmonella enterica]